MYKHFIEKLKHNLIFLKFSSPGSNIYNTRGEWAIRVPLSSFLLKHLREILRESTASN